MGPRFSLFVVYPMDEALREAAAQNRVPLADAGFDVLELCVIRAGEFRKLGPKVPLPSPTDDDPDRFFAALESSWL
jgi:hypothetical protein